MHNHKLKGNVVDKCIYKQKDKQCDFLFFFYSHKDNSISLLFFPPFFLFSSLLFPYRKDPQKKNIDIAKRIKNQVQKNITLRKNKTKKETPDHPCTFLYHL